MLFLRCWNSTCVLVLCRKAFNCEVDRVDLEILLFSEFFLEGLTSSVHLSVILLQSQIGEGTLIFLLLLPIWYDFELFQIVYRVAKVLLSGVSESVLLSCAVVSSKGKVSRNVGTLSCFDLSSCILKYTA